jgi:hypothetical protein
VVNFPVRLLGRVASATLTYGAAGRARSQANVLLGRGDFLFLTHNQTSRFQAPLMDSDLLDRLPKTDQVSKLELGEAIDLSAMAAQDNRGGHNRKQLDLERVRMLIAEHNYTAANLTHEFGINYNRAQRLVAITQAIEQGADASQISYQFEISHSQAQLLMTGLKGE